jgi:Flp pilus assembly pilin Flp
VLTRAAGTVRGPAGATSEVWPSRKTETLSGSGGSATPVPFDRRSGQGLIEYAVFFLLVAIVAVVALSVVGRQMLGAFQNIVSILQGP